MATRVLTSAKIFAARLVTGFIRTAPVVPGGEGSLDERHWGRRAAAGRFRGGAATEIASVNIEPAAAASPPASARPPPMYLLNSRLEKRTENRPVHETVSAPAGVAIKREVETRESPYATPCLSVIFGNRRRTTSFQLPSAQ